MCPWYLLCNSTSIPVKQNLPRLVSFYIAATFKYWLGCALEKANTGPCYTWDYIRNFCNLEIPWSMDVVLAPDLVLAHLLWGEFTTWSVLQLTLTHLCSFSLASNLVPRIHCCLRCLYLGLSLRPKTQRSCTPEFKTKINKRNFQGLRGKKGYYQTRRERWFTLSMVTLEEDVIKNRKQSYGIFILFF